MKSMIFFRQGPLLYKDQSSRHIQFAMALDWLILAARGRTLAYIVSLFGNVRMTSLVV